MYETKIIIPSRKGQGLADLAVEQQGPSLVGRATNVALVLVVLFLVYSVIEPFLGTSAGDAQRTALTATFEKLAEVLREHERVVGPITVTTVKELNSTLLDDVPVDPWGNDFVIDTFLKRVISPGPNGELDTAVLALASVGNDDSDDQIFSYNHLGHLWYSQKGADGYEIISSSVDGRRRELFAAGALGDVRDPNCRRDGKRIAAAVDTAGTGRQIVVCDDRGGQPEYLTSIGENRWPSWMADGTAVVYESKRNRDRHLFQYNVALSREEPITSGNTQYRTPRCHPTDSDVIACVGIRSDSRTPKIFLVSVETFLESAGPLNDDGNPEKSPAWCLDGKHLVFISKVGSRLQVFRQNIHNDQRQTIDLGAGRHPVDVWCSPFDPRVAVACKKEDGTGEIVIADYETGDKCVVINTPVPVVSLTWGP